MAADQGAVRMAQNMMSRRPATKAKAPTNLRKSATKGGVPNSLVKGAGTGKTQTKNVPQVSGKGSATGVKATGATTKALVSPESKGGLKPKTNGYPSSRFAR